MRFFIAIVAAFAIFPSAAHASWPEPLRRAIQIADDHWPNSPCHGRTHIVRIDEAYAKRLTQSKYDVAAFSGPYVGDGYGDDPCVISFVPEELRLPMRWKCRYFEHEFGHLAGMEHTYNRNDLMYGGSEGLAYSSYQSEDCWRAFKATPFISIDAITITAP